jgi:hypothetical protein
VASAKVVRATLGDRAWHRREGGHRVIFWKTFHSFPGERRNDRTELIDPARFLSEQLAQALPDLLGQMLTTFVNTLMSAGGRRLRRRVRDAQQRADQHL